MVAQRERRTDLLLSTAMSMRRLTTKRAKPAKPSAITVVVREGFLLEASMTREGEGSVLVGDGDAEDLGDA